VRKHCPIELHASSWCLASKIKMLKSRNGSGPLIHKVKILQFFRRESTALHFYQNRQLELYASREAKRLTLRQLVCLPSIMLYSSLKVNSCHQVYFGRSMNEERLFKAGPFFRFIMVQLYDSLS
jgi:pyruvate dehydrogenase kinase 2/3/4